MDEFLETAVHTAREAGKGIRKARESKGFTIDVKSGVDLVTTADRESEELIIGTLKGKFPDHEFIGEESSGALRSAPDGSLLLTDRPTWIM
jgi:fructose-1,6-bisphosphatase/inositol monophosphatase family enzyme